MWILVNVAMLVMATVIAGAAAVAVSWLLLRATVEIMRPAASATARSQKPITRNANSFREGSK